MSIITFNQLTEWKELPLKKVLFYYDASNRYTFDNLEESSTFQLIPITTLKLGIDGNPRVVAYRFEGKFVIIQNNFDDMKEFLIKAHTNTLPEQITIYFDPIERTDTNNYMNIIWRAGGETYAQLGTGKLTWEINNSKAGIELTILFTGMVSKDAISDDKFIHYIFQAW